jgi:hypothetical protein
VRILNPGTLNAAMSLARQVEQMELAKMPVPAKLGACGLLPPPPPRAAPQALPAPPAPLALPAPPVGVPLVRGEGQRRLSQEEMAERRRQGLCFNCNERYSRGHNRFCRRIFFVDGVEIDDGEAAAPAAEGGAPCFSLQAIAGVPVADTMQITVSLGPASLVALLDSGSTHNFISEAAAQRTRFPLQQRPRLTAMVANSERVTCVRVIRAAPLTIEGVVFPADLFVMPLAGYDVVLGTCWLGALGTIAWDLRCRRLSFQHQGRMVCWAAVAATGPATISTTVAPEPHLDALLEAFSAIFAEPAGLPPPCAHDHRITLKQGAQPVAVCPYHYPAAHKDELERQCAAMIEQGIVRRSDSPFSSPVLLVKKSDGSWRFCVDYRALNALTVKDAFPIPVVDELLDELHSGALLHQGGPSLRVPPGAHAPGGRS